MINVLLYPKNIDLQNRWFEKSEKYSYQMVINLMEVQVFQSKTHLSKTNKSKPNT